jgi:hypothetical protein
MSSQSITALPSRFFCTGFIGHFASILLALHLPSWVLFYAEPYYRTRDGFLSFWCYSPKLYLYYVLNQLDVFLVFVIVLAIVDFNRLRHGRKLPDIRLGLFIYVSLASVVYVVRCLGGFGGLPAVSVFNYTP